MILGLLLPIILASVFIIYNFYFSKYLKDNKIIEGLENNCNTERNKLLYKNSASVDMLKEKFDELAKTVNTMNSSLEQLTQSDNIQTSKIDQIEKEINKAKNKAEVAQATANKQKQEFNQNTNNKDDLL